ncbi:hypothetical protein [Cryobacterium lactosi]|uniref:hypothetical protein n=1 Tax=Cryobacterium lactosi TaxID=1259202 RepID=UPI00141AA6C6|nr:hypothetical protein [Cryobacterium lactosi]
MTRLGSATAAFVRWIFGPSKGPHVARDGGEGMWFAQAGDESDGLLLLLQDTSA